MSNRARRAITLGGVVLLTLAAGWWTWPRPAVHIRVGPGGVGVLIDRWGRSSPLPDTIFIRATGRNTRIRIENRDSTYQSLGIFGAAAHSERSFSVPLPGAYGGFCSAHPTSKRLTYVVQ